ncbi:hypothetical protein ADL12_22025 [Streptomyces regalis]|uniref:Uncharacterized protein n=1 Tax=Streptomyces regalis TaxID=68262 RepID=A0A101JUG7_9ACTN|nr:hypothetical protein ADL12_22025 [Streptomyces regalis]
MHAHVPAHEADDGHDHRLPQQRDGLRGVGTPQPRGAVQQQPGRRGLDGGDPAHGGGQQPRSQRPQHGHGEDRETDLAHQRARGEGDACAVRTTPPLDRESAESDDQRPVQDGALGSASVQQGDDDGHDHGRTADEDTGNRRFGRALGGDDGQVEADHADGREHREAGPLTGGECPQPGRGVPPRQRDEQETGEAVAQELTACVRVVAKEAVGGEGPSDEDTGERGEKGTARGGGVHGSDARKRRGPD